MGVGREMKPLMEEIDDSMVHAHYGIARNPIIKDEHFHDYIIYKYEQFDFYTMKNAFLMTDGMIKLMAEGNEYYGYYF